MSSHREAPEISKDPVADNADVYAFVSPDAPDAVTIISNFVPLQGPAGGPNFYEFGDDVLYSIYVDNDGDAQPEIEFQFRFSTTVNNPNTFLYNTAPITALTGTGASGWNRQQTYSVTRIDAGPKPPMPKGGPDGPADAGPAFPHGPTHATVLGANLLCPPCNIGPHSTPNYETALAAPAVQSVGTGIKVFCGQRQDPFHVDLGSIFDLGDLRPFQGAYNSAILPNFAAQPGVDPLTGLNIHTIAIQIPINQLTRDGSQPTNVLSSTAVLGIWSAASRRKVRMFDERSGSVVESGPWFQVSRLGNPLFNEVVVPMAQKDDWNRGNPVDDSEYLRNVLNPELANLIGNVLYPTAFTQLAGYSKPRLDLQAILLTGIPGAVTGNTFQNYTGPINADMLRLNVAVTPKAFGTENQIGLIAGDAAGFPNGRRLIDDVVAIEIKAIAGATIDLVDPSYVADGAAGLLNDGTNPHTYMNTFPYVGSPLDGYHHPPATP